MPICHPGRSLVDQKYAKVAGIYAFYQTSRFSLGPFWEDHIAPDLLAGKNVIIAAHGNSLRALTKYIENISDEDIINLEMATGEPVVYDFDEKLNVTSKEKLGK